MQRKYCIRDFQEFAFKKQGKCLSSKFIGTTKKLTWECKEGHVWEATPSHIINRRWCPICAYKIRGDSRRGNIKDMKKIAEKKGGSCLSNSFINARTKLKWQCEKGHTWEAVPMAIKRGSWCPTCLGHNKKIGDMQNFAKKKGGRCLSTDYTNNRTKLIWQCKEGHIWKSAFTNIQRGKWCPTCSRGISERICKKHFEIIFQKRFPKSRPSWLKSSKNSWMELDGYNKKLGIAFEYQGLQHFKEIPHFHKSSSFEKRKKDDELKKFQCREQNIKLIEVPYNISYKDMKDYIIQKCKDERIKVPQIDKEVDYKLFKIYSPEKIKEMRDIAKSKGGRCLSKNYINDRTKLKWQCEKGHTWKAIPLNVKRGSWCPTCLGRFPTVKDMIKIARKKSGKFLSSDYKGPTTKHKWQCEKGHIWEAIPTSIKQGFWCPFCANNLRLNITDVQKLAVKMGGVCLSNEYVNARTKLIWKCKEGHIWESTQSNVKKGHWCPKCAIKKNSDNLRANIKEMKQIAKLKGGECISKRYTNCKEKLKWQCEKGHIWEATPDNIKRGRWCPICYKSKKIPLKK